MMKNKVLIGLCLGILSLFIGNPKLLAQVELQLDKTKSTLIVKGTSSLHDWEMTATDFEGTIITQIGSSGLEEISNASISCSAASITSDNRIMDNKAHDAIKAKKEPTITYKYRSIESLQSNGSSFTGKIIGILTIAGKSNTIVVPFSGEVIGSDELLVKGSFPLDEADYDIEPPTALMGTLKTGKDLTIEYQFSFNSNK